MLKMAVSRIEVRTTGPVHAPEGAAALLVKTFNVLHDLIKHQAWTTGGGSTIRLDDIDERHERNKRFALRSGLCAMFAHMLASDDPRTACDVFSPWTVTQEAAGHVNDTIRNWVMGRMPLRPHEDTDEVWELFFRAVAAAEKARANANDEALKATAFELVFELNKLTEAEATDSDWMQRVWYYADNIAPEYRRWFSHLLDPADVELPRI
jgi:hypothetical protein